jgi:hypothetical protein
MIMSLEQELADGLKDLGISLGNFANLTVSLDEGALSKSLLADIVGGKKVRHIRQLLMLKDELIRVRQKFSPVKVPLPIDWSQTSTIKLLVFALRVQDTLEKEKAQDVEKEKLGS